MEVECDNETVHAAIITANTSNDAKISKCFEKSLGMMLNLSNAPLIFQFLFTFLLKVVFLF